MLRGGFVVLLPGDPGGLTGSRCSSYETCLDRQAWRILANVLCWWEDRLEGAGTFQKGIWDYQVREEIITKRTGRETQKRRELGKRRGNLCEEERRRKKKAQADKKNETKFQTGKTAGTFITVKLSKSREMKTGDNSDVTAELLRRRFRHVFAVKSTEFSEHQRH